MPDVVVGSCSSSSGSGSSRQLRLFETVGTSGYCAPEVLECDSYGIDGGGGGGDGLRDYNNNNDDNGNTNSSKGYHYPCDVFSLSIIIWKLFCNPFLYFQIEGGSSGRGNGNGTGTGYNLLGGGGGGGGSSSSSVSGCKNPVQMLTEFNNTFENPFAGKDSMTAIALMKSSTRPNINHSMFPDVVVSIVTSSWRYDMAERPTSELILLQLEN